MSPHRSSGLVSAAWIVVAAASAYESSAFGLANGGSRRTLRPRRSSSELSSPACISRVAASSPPWPPAPSSNGIGNGRANGAAAPLSLLSRRQSASASSSSLKNAFDDDFSDTCEIGVNAIDECSTIPATESQASTSINLAKCICGAGSFALPHVFLEEGVLGGTLAITVCAVLATTTMQSLADSKLTASEASGRPVTSYVQLARTALGDNAAIVVFALTLSASLGVCSTYLVFIGQTLESMSNDVGSDNVVRALAPDVSEFNWELGAALALYPLSLIRDYSIFAFTSALGVVAVVGGIATVLAYGVFVDPGGGLGVALDSIETLPMWPQSLSAAFGGSFGTICYLFAINFLTFPVINSMAVPREYNAAIRNAVAGVWIVNVAFAIVALGFYREETQDLVLANLSNGPYLSALKLLLCIDLLFTFPIVFSSGRQILENALIGVDAADDDEAALQRAGIVAAAVAACFGLAQIGGFGAVANLVGGVAQGTLAFIMPPAVALALAQKDGVEDIDGREKAALIGLAGFGVAVVSAVTYFTVTGQGA